MTLNGRIWKFSLWKVNSLDKMCFGIHTVAAFDGVNLNKFKINNQI